MNDSPATLSRSRFRFLCALLFCTGMTSLVFQIIWLRGFGIILGSTIYSMACVVTVFMLGLALGSLIMSQAAEARPEAGGAPAGGLRHGGAAGGAQLAARHLDALHATRTSTCRCPARPRRRCCHGWPRSSRVCLALIGIPTTLMGMTLPLLSQLVVDRRQVSALYGINTIGARHGEHHLQLRPHLLPRAASGPARSPRR